MTEQLPIAFEFKANQSFDDFFPGGNQVLTSQLQQAAAGDGEAFIYLWGKESSGKSHLLNACCQAAAARGLSTIYLDLCEPDVASNPEITAGLEHTALVCLDNIDKISQSPAWELALFNLFNQIRELDHRLVISAICPPTALKLSLADLQTRLNWGLALKIKPLDDNEKIAALIYKAHRMGIALPPQSARFLLSRYERNLASLWAILDKLDLASLAAKRKLTIPFLKIVLDETALDISE